MNGRRTFLLFVGGILAALAQAMAQDEPPPDWPGFAVGPVEQKLVGDTGQTVTEALTVATRGPKSLSFDIEVRDLAQPNALSILAVPRGEGARSCAEWITITNRLEVPPNGRISVPYSIRIPPGARGEYYAFVVIRLAERQEAGSRIVFRTIPSIHARIEIKVQNQPARLSMNVSGLRVEPARENQPAQVIVQVHNTGELKTPLEGDILFRGPIGTFPFRVTLPHQKTGDPLEIYPGATVDIACPLLDPLPPGRYTAQVRGVLLGNRRMQSEFEVEVGGEQGQTALGKFLGSAAFKVNLGVEPGMVNLDLPKGARRSVVIRLQNNGDQPLDITAQPALVRIEPDGLLTYTTQWEAGTEPWVQVADDRFSLAPRRSTAVRAQVTIPRERPESGTIACAVVIQGRVPREEGKEEAVSMGEYPVLILARDPKAPPARLEPLGMELMRSSPEANPTTALVRVKNTGGQLGTISGQMWLEGPGGRKMVALTIGEEQKEKILPQGIREFRLPLPPLDKGDYTVVARLNLGQPGEAPLELKESFQVAIGVPEELKGEAAAAPAPEDSSGRSPASRSSESQ